MAKAATSVEDQCFGTISPEDYATMPMQQEIMQVAKKLQRNYAYIEIESNGVMESNTAKTMIVAAPAISHSSHGDLVPDDQIIYEKVSPRCF